ncbi:MAG: hypothetical protein WA347_00610 [Rhabdochlamydiaceae bacterium]
MPNSRVFNRAAFTSYADLQNFFRSSEAVQQVLASKDKSYTKVPIPLNSNLAGKWLVCQMVTAPFRSLFACALNVIAKAALCLGATHLATQAKIGARYQKAGFELYSDVPTKLFEIKKTANRPNAQGQIVAATPSIPVSLITDPKVKKRTYGHWLNTVNFNHRHGICRGMSFWFLYLYLKTKDQFCDLRSHMAALGNQFATGGGMDPTLLHSINLRKGKLLGLKIGTQASHAPEATRLFKHTTHEWKSLPHPIAGELQNMPEGAYAIRLPLHTIAYIKINDSLGYFFDANHGITEINGIHTGEKLYQLISKSYEETGDIPPANTQARVRSNIDITPVALR